MCCNTQVERTNIRQFPDQIQIASFIIGQLGGIEEARKYQIVINIIAAIFAKETIAAKKLHNHLVEALSPLCKRNGGENFVLRFFMRNLAESLSQRDLYVIQLPSENDIVRSISARLLEGSYDEEDCRIVPKLAEFIVKVETTSDERQIPNDGAKKVVTTNLIKILANIFEDRLLACSTSIPEIQRSRKCVIL